MTPATIEQRVEWLEEINKLVTKDEFRAENDITRREFRVSMGAVDKKFDALGIKINSLEGSLTANIIMVDERISSIRWFLGFIIALILGFGFQDTIKSFF